MLSMYVYKDRILTEQDLYFSSCTLFSLFTYPCIKMTSQHDLGGGSKGRMWKSGGRTPDLRERNKILLSRREEVSSGRRRIVGKSIPNGRRKLSTQKTPSKLCERWNAGDLTSFSRHLFWAKLKHTINPDETGRDKTQPVTFFCFFSRIMHTSHSNNIPFPFNWETNFLLSSPLKPTKALILRRWFTCFAWKISSAAWMSLFRARFPIHFNSFSDPSIRYWDLLSQVLWQN